MVSQESRTVLDIHSLHEWAKQYLPRCHPVLFAIFPLLYVASQNTAEVGAGTLAVPLLVVIIIIAVIGLLLASLKFPPDRIPLILTFSVIWFFSYRAIGDIPIGHSEVLLAIRVISYCLLLPAGVVLLTRVKVPLASADRILALVAAALCLTSACVLVAGHISMQSPLTLVPGGNEWKEPIALNGTPDIYFIILDSYAGDEFLSLYFGYDNREFLDALAVRGFSILPQSRSNFHSTLKSLASTLNMEYIPENASVDQLSRMLGQNRVMSRLHESGYRTYTIVSGYAVIDQYLSPDEKIDTGILDEFCRAVLDMSIVGYPLKVEDKKIRTLRALSRLEELATVPGPKFVYAHIDSPHRPYVFTGEGRTLLLAAPDTDTAAYLSELKYLNDRLIPLIDSILNRSASPPVIIIASDHGSRLYGLEGDLVKPGYLSNLLAIRFPDGAYREFPRGITLVNTFRVVFSHLSNETFPLLPDRVSLKGKWQEDSS